MTENEVLEMLLDIKEIQIDRFDVQGQSFHIHCSSVLEEALCPRCLQKRQVINPKEYRRNLDECPSFKEQSYLDFGIGADTQLNEAVKTPDEHLSVFLVALCKWMIGIGVGQQPPFKVSVTSTLGYRVLPEAAHNDLVSIAFKFDPTFAAAPDPMAIARVEDARTSECKLAADAVRPVKKLKCVDTILRDDPQTMSSMVEATAELLTLARYDIAEFRAWLHTL